jgi:hypothetical protein
MRILRNAPARTVTAAAAATAAAALVITAGPGPATAATAAPMPGRAKAASPVAGVVPGLTGPAARQAAGAATDRFERLTAERTHTATGHTPTGHTAAPQAAQLHTAWGVNLPNSASKGLQAAQSVIGGAKATNGGDYVYAPTALPAGGACIEMTTAYTPAGPDLWAWDWCGGRDTVGKLTRMDSTFLATYTTTVNGHPAYSLDEHQTSSASNTWTAYLYNYRTHTWDSYYTSSGAYDLSGYPFGWDMFEVYTSVNPSTGAGYYCRDLSGQVFESSGIRVFAGSSWTPAAPGNSTPDSNPPAPGSSLDCPSMTISLVHPNDDWAARIN